MSAEEKNSQQSEDSDIDDTEYDKPLIPNPVWQKDHTVQTIEEIQNYQIKSRPLIKMQFIKKRKEFGKTYKLNDADANEKLQDIKPGNDPFSCFQSKVIDIGLQGCNRQKSTAAQTVWNRKINKSITVEDDIQKLDIAEDNPDLLNFISNVQYEIEEALQSNETIDIFQDDFDLFTNDDITFGADSELSTQIREWKSFFYNSCRGKKITNIQFQPSTSQYKSKYIAASFMENLGFDDRVLYSYKSHKNMIVLWDYDDQHSIDPVMVLVSPLEILSFAFNPKDPWQLVGGAINGQILQWDLKQADKLATQQQNKKQNKQKQEKTELVELQPVIMSHLQDPLGVQSQSTSTEAIRKNIPSHKNPVLSLQWLPQGVCIDKKNITNITTPAPSDIPHQFATISCDGQVLLWDNKFLDNKGKPITDLSTVTWKSMFGIQLFRPQGGGQMGGAQIAFRKNQKTGTFTGTSDEGEVFFVDWAAKASEEEDKVEMVQQFWQNNRNYRPTVGLDVSPFFPDIILSLHDFHFTIWKHNVKTPIFESNILKGAQITCGAFSPSRPGVIMIGRTDGNLDIWDFLDQSHKATMQFQVISKMLTCMKFNDQSINNLAIGDIDGSLHIIEIPTTLCRKLGDEEKTMEEFWAREVQRVDYFKSRFELREELFKKEKQDREKQEQKQDGQKSKEDEKKLDEDELLEKEYQEFAEQYISEQINKEPPKEPEPKDKKK